MNRFFIDSKNITRNRFWIEDVGVVKHARKVLRVKVGDDIKLFDGNGFEYYANVEKITKDVMQGEISEVMEIDQLEKPVLILAQALPKAGKIDQIIKMNTEIGVAEFSLFESDYSVSKIKNWKKSKLERLERVIMDASRQCERTDIPVISPPETFEEVLSIEADIKILLHSREVQSSQSLKKLISDISPDTTILVIIGPEGGFSPEELSKAEEYEFDIAYLELPILRTETAGVVVSSIILS